MNAEIINVEGDLITAKISGQLTETELLSLQRATAEIIQQRGKARLLVLVENFLGWQKGGTWSDLSFQMDHDEQIEKMAIVGDRKWKDLALIFTAQGLRKFPIEYFDLAEKDKALAWLG